MNSKWALSLAAAANLLVWTVPILAHPHARFYLDVKDEIGQLTN